MIRANVEDDREVTIARLLNGLNKDIANEAEPKLHANCEDMILMAIKLERQLTGK